MILTIKNQPYITLDNFLPVKNILDLQHDLEFLLSANTNIARTGIWNAGGHSPDDIKNALPIHREKSLLYYTYAQANNDRRQNQDLDKHLSYFERSNDRTGLSRYLKLRYNAFDPYTIINLRRTTGSYYSADSRFTDAEWNTYSWFDIIDDHPKIKNYIENELPFDRLGIVTVFFNEHFVPQCYHRDFNYFPYEKGNQPDTFPHKQEFIWFRFDLQRPFYIFDIDSEKGKIVKKYAVKGHTAFFNHHNWHGSFDSYPKSSITLKVEGRFTEVFRKQIGIDNTECYQ